MNPPPVELQGRVRRLDTSLEATNTVPNHRAIPLLGQSCHRLLRPYNLIFGVLDAPSAQVIITKVEVQARSETRCRGNSDGCEVTVLEVCELRQGLLVPMSLTLKILLLVGQVVRQHAPLGMVFFDHRGHGRSDPAPDDTCTITQIADDVAAWRKDFTGVRFTA